MFTNFGKLQDDSKRNTTGTGLGLSICKKIIEKMGGSVEVFSEIGVGTEFQIRIKAICKGISLPELKPLKPKIGREERISITQSLIQSHISYKKKYLPFIWKNKGMKILESNIADEMSSLINNYIAGDLENLKESSKNKFKNFSNQIVGLIDKSKSY